MSESQGEPSAATDLLIGSKVGNYKLVRQLGVGGMGAVYEAVHELMGKKAAVKMLLPELSANQEIVGRFFNEAKAATKIQHAGIVDVYDFGYHASGHAYIVMEYLSGSSLADLLKKGLQFARALDISWQLCSALGAAHKNGIVHRDVKPDNIYIVPDPATPTGDRVKLLDFGISKLTGDDGAMQKTRTGTVMGTPAYMSPEQCRGSGEVDSRTDIYAVGCIMFEMVCGQPPFVRNGFGELITAHIIEEPPRPSEMNPSVPAMFEAIIMRSLEKDLDARYQTTTEMEADLGAINPAIVGDVMPAPAAGHAGGTGRSKMRTGSAAPTGRTRAGLGPPRTMTNVMEEPLPATSNKKVFAIAGGAVVLVGALVAVLASGGSEKPAATPIPVAAPAVEAPAEAKRVKLTIRSTPTGASVFSASDSAFLGKTPFDGTFPSGNSQLGFVIRAAGFADQKIALSAHQDGAIDVTLDAAPGQPAPVVTAAKVGKRSAAGSAKAEAKSGKNDPKGKNGKRDWGELVDF
ncbi:MAG: serine/threonine-protein kinase [Deltaproteobacteria bacterium]|nr:serine/threonine-protein kinase [Deltaproteobacteria bacterium]